MSRITGAHHTSFTVADLDKSLTFFRDLLGLEVVVRRDVHDEYFGRIVGPPGCAVEAAMLKLPGGHCVELFEYVEPRGQSVAPRPCDPGSSHLALLVQDLPALYDRLKAQGLEFGSPPVTIDAGPN